MAKRNATSELNHDNWNEEEAPEEAGTFCKATPDVMKHRIIRSAKRRSGGSTEDQNEAAKSPFATFGGFKAASNNPASTFSFLTKVNKPNDTLNSSVSKNVQTGSTDAASDSKSAEYYSKLKSLNQCVSQWIKSHVDSNPFCILTPIFRDYELYLTEIDGKESKQNLGKEADVTQKRVKSPEKSPEKSPATQGIMTKCDTARSVEGPATESKESEGFTQSSGSSTTTFSFGSAPSSSSNSMAGFTFGSSQPFTFSNVSKPEIKPEKSNEEEADEQPFKVEFTPVTEEGAIYSKRCKVFVKKEASFQERGVGMLYLKPVGEKTQLIVRANTSLGNLLVNTLLMASLPVQRMGSNNVMLVCLPTPDTKPPPVPVLFRFKTHADADEAFDKFKEYMK